LFGWLRGEEFVIRSSPELNHDSVSVWNGLLSEGPPPKAASNKNESAPHSKAGNKSNTQGAGEGSVARNSSRGRTNMAADGVRRSLAAHCATANNSVAAPIFTETITKSTATLQLPQRRRSSHSTSASFHRATTGVWGG
jgi:hypothetical protein